MQPTPQLNEENLRQLVEDSQCGNTEAFGCLYDALYSKIYNYAYKRTFDSTVAEDITANCFYNLMTHIASFKWRGGPRFYAWMFRIVMNEIATYYRQGNKYVLSEDWLDLADVTRDEDSQLDQMISSEEHDMLQRAIDTLPLKLSRVVELYYFAGLSHGEIARTLSISESAARVRLHRGVEKLHNALQGEEHAYRG